VVAVTVDGVVHPVTFEIISHALDQARQQEASLLLIRLNTPGGLMEATRQIVERLVASPVPVVTYVAPSGGRAASAGFFLLEAGDVAAMAPGTNTGAASPVLLIGGQMDAVMRRKVENDAAASIRSLVSKRGRNAELAEKTVLEARSFTDGEALSNRLIELVARDQDELLKVLDGREITRFDGRKQTLRITGASVAEYRPTMRESIISAVSDPNIAFILLVVGALGLYVEFSHPGLIAPGVAGAILVLLGLSALSVLPISITGVALLVLALVLFRAGSQVRLARDTGRRGRGGHGAGRAAAGGRAARAAHPLFDRHRRHSALRGYHDIPAFAGHARASRQGHHRRGRHAGRDRRRPHAARSGGQGVCPGRVLDAESPCPVAEGDSVRIVAVEGLKLRVKPIQEE